MFITFEGLDFCGKSTQVKLLTDYLTNIGKNVEILREPGGTAISEKIRNILLDKSNSSMKIETELLLYSASRSQLVRERIIPLLRKNYYVISDRFHDSSIAYQGYGRGINISKVREIQEFTVEGALPDKTYFIDIPVLEVKKRRAKLNKEKWDRLELLHDDFFERVREGYIKISKNDERFVTIDGLGTVEQIHDEIVKTLKLKSI